MHANDLFTAITDQLVADIEAGAGTWRMPWHTLADAGTPTSVDGRPYRGMNALWLPMVSAANGWTSGVWATYRGWQRHGAQVRRGERGTHVILWKPTNQTATTAEGDATEEPGQSRRRLLARAYCVFAAEQANPDRTESDRGLQGAREALVVAGVACLRPAHERYPTPRCPRVLGHAGSSCRAPSRW